MKNKKLLLSVLLSVFMMSSTFAQFRWQSDLSIGQSYSAVNPTNQDTLNVHFNTTSVANSFWLKSKKDLTKDSVVIKKAATQKGLQAIVYTDATTTTTIQSANFKCASYGGTGNPVHVASLDSLKKIMAKSAAITTTINGNAGDSLTAPAHCLFDVDGTGINQAYGVYPGKYKHIEYGFQFDLTGKILSSDITFTIDTYDAGTTGNTAAYELAVYNGTTIADANLISARIVNFYTTGSGKLNVSLASVLGKTISDLSNKKICIFLRTLGTKNSVSGLVDGIPNAADFTTHTPLATDPTIVFDNFNVNFYSAYWAVPAGATANSYINHNNGQPVATVAGDVTYGNPVAIPTGITTAVKFYLTSINRSQALSITENAHTSFFAFPATTAVNAKALDGSYSIPVIYTNTPSDGTTNFSLSIPAATAGTMSNDTLEITVNITKATAGSALDRLEISNGTRFWYNIAAVASVSTAVQNATMQGATIYSVDNKIIATNATETVTVFNIAGQKVKMITAAQAAVGINVQKGVYIVKTGNTTQKVLVQ